MLTLIDRRVKKQLTAVLSLLLARLCTVSTVRSSLYCTASYPSFGKGSMDPWRNHVLVGGSSQVDKYRN